MNQPQASARPPAVPPDRYGRRHPAHGRPGALIGGGVVVVLMLTFAVWMGVREARKPVRFRNGTFAALDDGSARLEFAVTTDPGRTVVCTVRIFNSGLTEVGRLDVTVGPSTEPEIRGEAIVPTFEPASSGQIKDCVVT